MGMYSLLCLKWISRTDLLSSAQNSAQYHVAVWMGRGFGGRMCVCVWLSPSPQCKIKSVFGVFFPQRKGKLGAPRWSSS